MKRWTMIFLAMLIGLSSLAATSGALADNENLLINGNFEELGADNVPSSWSKDMYVWDDGVTYFTGVSTDVKEGQTAARITNFAENDARLTQRVAVEPDSIYRLSGYVRARDCTTDGGVGGNLSIEDVFTHTTEIRHSLDNAWTYVEEYGITGPDQTSLVVCARLGFYGSMTVGTAWFDEVQLVKVDAAPAGVAIDMFYREEEPVVDEVVAEDVAAAASALDYRLAIGLICVAFAALYAFLLYRRERGKLPGLTVSNQWNGSLIALLGLALVIRLILAATISGYPNDIACWQGWSSRVVTNGPWGFYSADAFCDYPPGYMLLLSIVGFVRNMLNLSGTAYEVLVKLPPIICDLVTVALIYKWASEKLGKNSGMWLAAAYALAPAVMFDSAAWGQIDSVLTMLLLISIYYATCGKWRIAIPVYVFSALVKPQALMLGPVALIVVVMEIVWAKKNAQEFAFGANSVTKRSAYARSSLLHELLISLLISLGVIAVVVIPFWGNQPADWLITLYGNTLSSYNYAAVNALNIFSLFGKNWADATQLAGPITLGAWGMLMMALTFAYALFLYVRAHKREMMPTLCGMVLVMLFAFGTKMHERYAFPAIALLVLGYIFIRDKRLLYTAGAVSLTQFANMALVLHDMHLLAENGAINGIFAVTNIAAACYVAYVCFDICVLEHVKVYGSSAAANMRSDEARFNVDSALKGGNASRDERLRERIFTPSNHRLSMKWPEFAIVGLVTVVYAITAFTNLGSLSAPQTTWQSTAPDETVTFDLGETRTFHMAYYGNICDSSFYVSFSEDGETWSEEGLAQYEDGLVFRWLWYVPQMRNDSNEFSALESGYPMNTARYVRLRAETVGLKLMEVGFIDESGSPYPIVGVSSAGSDPEMGMSAEPLIDEQAAIPATPSYLNGTIFDEIYHARTAYEHLHNLHTYEWTHPPLGKVLMMLGIQLFGMTAFGWRFMGTLFGVFMVPAIYVLAKQLFKRRDLAVVAMVAFTFDFMHFTQTRLATIDTYGVFFIIMMYIFMFRYLQMSFFRDGLKKTLIPLGLCGLFMGLGIASKWIDIYAGGGLAVLFFASLFFRFQEYRFACRRIPYEKREVRAKYVELKSRFIPNTIITLLFCCVFFIAIPLLIYYFSYYWQLKPDSGLSIPEVWRVQQNIFNYHAGLTNDTHPFSAKWYTWPLILKPMYYYSGRFVEAGQKSIIWAMGNPAVWWTALACTVATAVMAIRERGRDKRKLVVLVSFLAQYLPWVLVPRSMYIYHYFASIPFIILCTMFVFEWFGQRFPRALKYVEIGYCAIVIALFVMFYPVISGAATTTGWVEFLSSLGPWNIY